MLIYKSAYDTVDDQDFHLLAGLSLSTSGFIDKE